MSKPNGGQPQESPGKSWAYFRVPIVMISVFLCTTGVKQGWSLMGKLKNSRLSGRGLEVASFFSVG